MTYTCPACQRTFEEAGFCPFDRAALIAPLGAGHATLIAPPGASIVAPIVPTHAAQGRPAFVPADRETAATSAVKAPVSAALAAVSASSNPAAALELVSAPRQSEYDRLIGQTLDGRYYVEKKIGEGGMGVVFSARHAVIERPLAIKVLKREVMRDAGTIHRFVQEAKAASRIGHPNIVDVTDFGTTPDGMTYSVMEFVAGTTLAAAIRHGAPFALPRAIRIAAQIARALGAAHDKGIVHRDLKPDNIFLVDREGREDFVKIVDFGIARVVPVDGSAEGPRLTRAGSVFGTPEYMAPEQAAGRGDADGRVDIYALGIILYEMVTGRVPHRGDSMVRTLAMQMLDPAEPLSKLRPDLAFPPAFEAIVARALTKKREARYQTMGELLGALEQFTRESLPPPVGVSVTGSPVYALSPLPPGADASLISASPGASHRVVMSPSEVPTPLHDLTPPPSAPPPPRSKPPTGAPRARAPSQSPRPRHEPEFVAAEKPSSFEHVWTDEYQPPPRRKWPLVLLGAMILGGAGGAIAVMLKSRASVTRDHGRDAALGTAPGVSDDARGVVIAEVPGDAARPDDATAAPDDAAQVAMVTTTAPRDAGPRPLSATDGGGARLDAGHAPTSHPIDPRPPRDGGPTGPVTHPSMPDTPNGRGTLMIQVLTRPEGGTLYVGTTYRGPGGTSLEERPGTTYQVECRLTGYKPGRIDLRFDGKTEIALCKMERIKRCVGGLKNPFDKCDEAAP